MRLPRKTKPSENLSHSDRFGIRPVHIARWLAVLAAVFLASVSIGSPRADAAPADGVLFGAYVQPRGGQTSIEAVERLESQLGSKLPLVRRFARWDSTIDNRTNNWAVDGGRRLMVSIKPERRNGSEVRWAAIANAQPGSTIHNEMVALARDIKRLDGEVWVSFHHEPEAKDRVSFGDNSDYKNAWRKIHSVFEEENASVRWVWTMTSWSFEVDKADRRSAGKWYPGDAYVDYLGADPYNWYQCRGDTGRWRTLEELTEGFRAFGADHPTKGRD